MDITDIRRRPALSFEMKAIEKTEALLAEGLPFFLKNQREPIALFLERASVAGQQRAGGAGKLLPKSGVIPERSAMRTREMSQNAVIHQILHCEIAEPRKTSFLRAETIECR